MDGGNPFCKKIQPLINGCLWSELEELFAVNRTKLTWYSLSSAGRAEIKSFYLSVKCNIQRLLRPSGLFIAFVGPDGCGKTTLQEGLKPFFAKGFTKGKIKRFYWRPFLFPRIKTLVTGKRNPEPDEAAPSDRLKLRTAGLGKRAVHSLKLFYYWLDYIFGRIKIQGTWSRGGVVCFDRYWHDLLVFPERFGLNVPKKMVKFLTIFVPKPDIIFYLHAEPEVLIRRKPELPLNEIKQQVEQYKNMTLKERNCILINGEQSKEEVLRTVTATCLQTMSSRY